MNRTFNIIKRGLRVSITVVILEALLLLILNTVLYTRSEENIFVIIYSGSFSVLGGMLIAFYYMIIKRYIAYRDITYSCGKLKKLRRLKSQAVKFRTLFLLWIIVFLFLL